MGVFSKVGKWIIRPSIFNLTPGASNPFYDVQKAMKKMASNKKINVMDLNETEVGRKHLIMVNELQKVPLDKRYASAHLQIALALLYGIIYIFSLIFFFGIKTEVFERISTPFVQVINEDFGFVYYVVLIFITIGIFSHVISSLWRASILRDPDNSVPFPVYFSRPKLWFQSIIGGTHGK
ncbi:hypothetical protein HNW13_018225 [Shewanella sp. BF02_Schw]|uniref:hypothetical protein n=1 Tax=Shewanella sp. BF02_Schw TaxID=394908 RepID=UPI00178473B4|nr:hypothetical protein [Shewanella sp. BF02_Schw]MBO1897678.1 hypothetical protein [Shewanella sp. BF02_Schw]